MKLLPSPSVDLHQLEDLEAARGLKAKKALLAALNKELLGLLEYALDPELPFPISDYRPPASRYHDAKPQDSSRQVRDFMDFLDALSQMPEVSYADRLNIDIRFRDYYTPMEQKWFARVMNKDLQCGVTERIFLSVFPDAFQRSTT
jgi:hypothetical protein